MNRTAAYATLAASLLLVAVVLGLPRAATVSPAPPPVPVPVPLAAPLPSPAPTAHPGALTLTGKLSHPYVPAGASDVFATLAVTAVEVPGERRAPVNLAVVLDRSGSMAGAKLQSARRAALKLVDLLDENDRLSIVQYGTDVQALRGTMATAEGKARLRRYLQAIEDGGGTNTSEALWVGKAQLDQARSDFKVNRLLLLSDGQPTVGITSPAGLVRLTSQLRAGGVTVTALGVGADFNEDLMQRLAAVGGGAYGFISELEPEALTAMFEKDLRQAGTMVARGVSLQVTLPEGVTFQEVYGRAATQTGRVVSIALPDFSAGQEEKLVLRLSARTSAPADATLDVAGCSLDYQDLLADRAADSKLTLAALVTDDLTLAMNKRDKGAYVEARRAQAAVNYKKAATLMEAGDFGQAQQAIRGNEALFDDAAAVGGLDAVKDDRKQNANMLGLATSAPAAPAPRQRETVKALKVQELRGSGFGTSSVY